MLTNNPDKSIHILSQEFQKLKIKKVLGLKNI